MPCSGSILLNLADCFKNVRERKVDVGLDQSVFAALLLIHAYDTRLFCFVVTSNPFSAVVLDKIGSDLWFERYLLVWVVHQISMSPLGSTCRQSRAELFAMN